MQWFIVVLYQRLYSSKQDLVVKLYSIETKTNSKIKKAYCLRIYSHTNVISLKVSILMTTLEDCISAYSYIFRTPELPIATFSTIKTIPVIMMRIIVDSCNKFIGIWITRMSHNLLSAGLCPMIYYAFDNISEVHLVLTLMLQYPLDSIIFFRFYHMALLFTL